MLPLTATVSTFLFRRLTSRRALLFGRESACFYTSPGALHGIKEQNRHADRALTRRLYTKGQ